MGYDLKNVFYLDGSVSTDQADGTVGVAGDSFSGQFDLSSMWTRLGKAELQV